MLFPNKPKFFDLNELECGLLAPRIAFQKLMQAPRGKQLKIHSNVVNEPADLVNTVSMLPWLPSETGTVKVNLKRKLQYKSSAMSLNVRPHKVVQAVHWLTSNSGLYQDEGVALNADWIIDFNGEILETESSESACHQQYVTDEQNCNNVASHNLDDEDEWSEDEVEVPAGVTDTMLTVTDFLEDNEHQNILNVAPAEGNRPLSIFRDKHSEELAYPGIFLGQKRPENEHRMVKVHYSDVCKSELYKTKKLEMKIILGKSQIAQISQCTSLNAGRLKQQGTLEGLIHHDEGFKFLRVLRGSPLYFEKAKKDLFALIRQLGPALLFCSFSSAETQWVHLLRILGQLIDHKKYNNDELENLKWEDKCRLIQSDPVTCARHFDYQACKVLNNFLLTDTAPLGKISDWFYRVEYQQ